MVYGMTAASAARPCAATSWLLRPRHKSTLPRSARGRVGYRSFGGSLLARLPLRWGHRSSVQRIELGLRRDRNAPGHDRVLTDIDGAATHFVAVEFIGASQSPLFHCFIRYPARSCKRWRQNRRVLPPQAFFYHRWLSRLNTLDLETTIVVRLSALKKNGCPATLSISTHWISNSLAIAVVVISNKAIRIFIAGLIRRPFQHQRAR